MLKKNMYAYDIKNFGSLLKEEVIRKLDATDSNPTTLIYIKKNLSV